MSEKEGKKEVGLSAQMDPATIALLAKIISDLLMMLFLKVQDTTGMTDAEKQAMWEAEKAKTDSGVQRLLDIAAGKI